MFEAKIHGCEIKGQAIQEKLVTAVLSQKESEVADKARDQALERVKARFSHG